MESSIILQLLLVAVLVACSGACTTDDECTVTNQECKQGTCTCLAGFETSNGVCTKVLGKDCQFWSECSDVANSECSISGTCGCTSSSMSAFYELNNVCVTVIGRTCTDDVECLGVSQVTCRDNQCKCFDGYSDNGGFCSQTSCSIDDDCADPNTYCKDNYCKCSEGFDHEGGVCTKVLGRECGSGTERYYCDYSLKTTCNYTSGVCGCRDGYTEENDACTPALGKDCRDDVDCNSQTSGIHCEMDICECKGSYVQYDSTMTCSRIYYSSCSEDSDCLTESMENIYCEESSYSSRCRCITGAFQDSDYFCKKVIGSPCSSYCSSPPYYCDLTNTCRCGFGTIVSADGLACESVINEACTTSEECNDSNIYQCVEGFCVCSDAYMYHGFDTVWNYDIPCVKAIGRLSCNASDSASCTIPNTKCNDELMCVCSDGFLEIDGTCTKGLGIQCYHDAVCSSFDVNSVCSVGKTCMCKNGFIETDGFCIPDTDKQCADSVPTLPDITRRLRDYNLDFPYEESIDDTTLEETWYSLGQHLLLVSSTSPLSGACGAAFPIYIESEDLTILDHISEQATDYTAKIGGLDEFNMDEQLTVKLRKCGYDTQMKIQKPTKKLAAYCLDGTIGSLSRPQYSPVVSSELRFQDVSTEYWPYLLFNCDIFVGPGPWSSTGNSHDFETYFIINWYVNGTHLISFGPVTRENLNATQLFEPTLLQYGIKIIGFKIQCSYQYLEGLSGVISSSKFSAPLDTNIKTHLTQFGGGQTGHYFTSPEIQVPLGCISSKGEQDNKCKYKYGPGEEVTTCDRPSNQHDLCGIMLNATTCYGHGKQLSESFFDMTSYEYKMFAYDEYDDENGYLIKEYMRSNFSIHENTNELDDFAIFRFVLDSQEMNTGHPIWDGYKLGDIQILSYPYPFRWSMRYIYISKMDYFMYAWDSGNGRMDRGSASSSIETGEYIMYRSKLLPVEIQMKVEVVDGIQRICGLAIRNGNTFRIESNCDNINITACFGDDTQSLQWDNNFSESCAKGIHMSVSKLVNVCQWNWHMTVNLSTCRAEQRLSPLEDGTLVSLYLNLGSISSIYFYGVDSSFKNAEGVMTMGDGYHGRDGTTHSSVREFERSWRISAKESLRNPSNQGSVRYNRKYYLCECPASTEVFEDRLSDDGTINFNGAFKCTTDCQLEETVEGDAEWPGSLLPDYVLHYVNISVEATVQDLKLRCDFATVDGYFYRTKWYVDGALVKDKSEMEANDYHYISTDELLALETLDMSLNSEIICSAAVYGSLEDEDPLLPYINSSGVIPVQLSSTKLYVTRGGQAVISLQRNIPLVCENCVLDIKVIDEDSSSFCVDSTIAVVDKDMCGHTLHGSLTADLEPSSIDIMITTINSKSYTLKTYYSLQLVVQTSMGVANPLWNLDFNTSISVYVTDNNYNYWQGKRCYVNNDPRLGTFDGIHYYMPGRGEYVLLAYISLNIQVQIQTMSCNGGWGTCSCGVTIQVGRDVFMINHCGDHHITKYLLREDHVLLVVSEGANRYKITLPQGTVVIVRVSPWRWYLVNVDIFPTSSDIGDTWGLCGYYNGDKTDDFRHRDGTKESTTWGYYYYRPTDFVESWRVDPDTESLSNINETEKYLKPWEASTGTKCACPSSDASPICQTNEEMICISNNVTPLKIFNRTNRKKRSAMIDQETVRKLQDIKRKRETDHVVKRSTDVNEDSMTLDDAKASCLQSLIDSCEPYSMLDTLPVQDEDQFVNNCAEDLRLNPDVDWATETCSIYQVIAEVEIEKNTTFQTINPVVVQTFEAKKCPGKAGCSGNGQCENGTCVCYSEFGSDDCYIRLTDAPVITLTMTDDTCDMNLDDGCDTCIPVTTNGTLESATCFVTIIEIVLSGVDYVEETTTTETFLATYINFNEMECCLPETARRKRSTQSSNIAVKYGVAVSNDGINYGNTTYMYVLDTTCQETGNDSNGNTIVLLKTGYCYIEGVCKGNYTHHDTDTCLVCLPDTDAFQWTQDGCTTTTSGSGMTTSDDDNTVLIIIIVCVMVTVLSVAVGGVAVAAYFKKKNRLNPEIPPPRYADQVMNVHFSRSYKPGTVHEEKHMRY